MDGKEQGPATGLSEDPDSPVTVDMSDADVATPAAVPGDEATPAPEDRGGEEPAVITNDPDAPVTVDVTALDVENPSDGGAEPEAVTNDPDAPVTVDVTASDVESPAAGDTEPAVITNDPDAPVTVDVTALDVETPASGDTEPAVVTSDPDAPVAVDVTASDVESPADGDTEPTIATDADAPVTTDVAASDVGDSTPELVPLAHMRGSEAVFTADPDESLFPPGGTDEFSPDQLLVGVEQPKRDDEIARRLAVLEAIVYVTDEPLSAEQIAKAMGEPLADIKLLLDQLVAEYNRPEHGLTVKEVAGGYKMATKPEHHEAVRTFVKNLNPPLKLSLAALETLAVIAYKQPITAPEIMEIRGVQGAGVLKTLIDRKLITTAGRKNVVGKPILYKTTKEFLVQFGLRDLAELPTLKEFEDLRRMAFTDADDALADSVDGSRPPEPEADQAAEPSPETEA